MSTTLNAASMSRRTAGRQQPALLTVAAALALTAAPMHGARAPQDEPGSQRATQGAFSLAWSDSGLTSLKAVGDRHDTDYLAVGRPLGDIVVHYRWAEPGERWKQARTDNLGDARRLATTGDFVYDAEYTVTADDVPALAIRTRFGFAGEQLRWQVGVRNLTSRSIEIGDIALPLRMNTGSADTPSAIYEQRVIKHHFVGGQGSFLYWTRPNGVGPFLTMTPDLGTRLEYSELTDQVRDVAEYFHVYIHSAVKGGLETRGTWRQPHTSTTLAPAGSPTAERRYGFEFRWARDHEDVREVLYARGLPDIRVVPGMTVPIDLAAKVAVRSREPIAALVAEHAAQTRVARLGSAAAHPDTTIYELTFSRLGENWVDVRDADGRSTRLEFFVTEPLETLIRKRTRFLVTHQQHRRPDRWYDGLFSVWDMRGGVLRGPDDTDGYDGWWGYVLAADDPGLSKAPLIAAKNRHYPDRREIEALEYYLERFVWGKLQRTDLETPYPYAVYGVPNWHENRTSPWGFGSNGKGLEHVWRTYDYPHIVMLYFHLYEIATQYPGMTRYLDAAGYLERATRTARAYFEYPYKLRPWYEIYKWGCYNELVILDLIEALEAEGRADDARWLRAEWEKKVKYFIYDDAYPFRSEYSFDTTAFESSHAIARYALANELAPDENSWYDVNLKKWWSHREVPRQAVHDFMDRQLRANLAARGVIEPAYYFLGSDYRRESNRYSLSYMSQMGGWALLDYGLHVAHEPTDWLRIGYASYLSSWALMNTGTEESGFGYWAPGRENDGAAGWGFNAEKFGSTWIRKDIGRGAWPYDGEIDLGFAGALRSAATVVTDDPLFGWMAYGGTLQAVGPAAAPRGAKRQALAVAAPMQVSVIPRDGLRQRLHVIDAPGTRLHVTLDWDGFAADAPVELATDGSRLSFVLENRSTSPHRTTTRITGFPAGRYEVLRGGAVVASATVEEGGAAALSWQMVADAEPVVVRRTR